MDIKRPGLGIFYNHTRKEDKHFFGGFLNLAQNNINSVLKSFSEKFKTKEINESKFADSSLKDSLSDTDFQNRIAFLQAHFPVVGYLGINGSRVLIRKKITLLFNAINALRNFYTHYYHRPLTLSDDLFELLDELFVDITIKVKQHKMKDDKTRHLLSRSLSEELEIRYQQNLNHLKELKAQGKKVNLHDTDGIKNGVLNNAFSHLIYKKDEKYLTTFLYQSVYRDTESAENGINISQSGLLFLLSMFLMKKEIEDLKSRVKGFKAKVIKEGEENISGLKFMATHWVFSYLAFKGNKKKLSTDFHEETLLIQIIDELSKVPDEVYVTFDKKLQDQFIEDINEYIKEGKEELSLDAATVVYPVIRKRYENKFNYFAIRFLDEFVQFPTLRFQVHVGNYVHDRRTKNIEGTGFQTERTVKERIKVFGRLSEISKLKTEFIRQKLDITQETGWELFPSPSYVFIDNNIPIHLTTDKNLKKEVAASKAMRVSQQPEERKKRGKDKKAKYEIVNMIGQKSVLNPDEPVALFSLNEIPALLYEILIRKTPAEEIEKVLVDKLNNRFDIIKNYNPENPLPASQISKRLRNNKGSETINTIKLVQLIEKEIEISNQKLNELLKHRKELKEKRKGKSVREVLFTSKELGTTTTWLANDIKRFMPENVRENWKGYQHSQFQQSLAFYDKRPKEAFSILQEVWELDRYSWSEWIFASFNHKFFDGFYEGYLERRLSYFQLLSENIIHYTSNKKNLFKFMKQQMPKNLFEKRLYLTESLEKEKSKILSMPFVFPRGIFDDKPTFIKGVKVTESPERFADWYLYGYKEDEEFQKFYQLERDYKDLFLICEKEKKENFHKNGKNLTQQQQMELLKMKHDLKIKKIKTQDLFLKLIADKLFEHIFKYLIDFKLGDLYLTQQERLEKEKEALSQSQREEGDNSPNIINDNFIWSKTVPYENGQVYEPEVKLKDLGKFDRFMLDQKVETLFSYNKNKKWNKSALENELSIGDNSYEVIRREKIFKQLQRLENEILQKWGWDGTNHPYELEDKDKRNPNFKIYLVNGVLRKEGNIFENGEDLWLENLNGKDFETLGADELSSKTDWVQLVFLLTLIRNKFAHNQLPAKQFYTFIEVNYPEISGSTVSEFYLNFTNFAIKKLKEKL